MAHPEASIVIPVHNEGTFVALTIEAILATTDVRTEIVVVDDGSTDGCCDFLNGAPSYSGVRLVSQMRRGIAAARNRGAGEASAPILVFLDGHSFPTRGWLEGLMDVLERQTDAIVAPCISVAGHSAVKGYGMTITDRCFHYQWLSRDDPALYEVPVACGCCLAMRRDFFYALGAFDAMRLYGVEDVELSIRCWLSGHVVLVAPEIEVAHRFKDAGSPAISWEDYVYNALRTAVLHFDGHRRERIVEELAAMPGFTRAAQDLLVCDVWDRYQEVRGARRRDGDWFCERFGIDL